MKNADQIPQLTFLKEHFGSIPDALRAQGYAVLAFDARNWGSSGGTPRQHTNLYEQSDDISDAVTFVRAQPPAIDPNRICLFGAGHGGGVIIPVAATDPRIKATVAAMPFISGLWDSSAWPKGHAELLWLEREEFPTKSKSCHEPLYVPIFPESLPAAQKNPTSTVIGLPQIVAFKKGAQALSDAAGTPWDNKVTIQTLFHQRRWEPSTFLPQITIPFLYITAKRDEFTPHESHMEAYGKIQSPKDLLVLESENLAAFVTPETQKQMLEKLIEFLKSNL